MGCGGSRADTIIEPRYHESWTRETESTWLTNTDIDTPLPASNILMKAIDVLHPRPTREAKGLESSLKEKRMVNTGTQCGKQPLPTTGSNYQRRSRRSCNEPTRDSRRRASKEANPLTKELPPVNSCAGVPVPCQDCDDR